jgi:hypothetical protein
MPATSGTLIAIRRAGDSRAALAMTPDHFWYLE